ncbi:hypothetical protein [Xylophilus sp.]|nr:hypothetical protein [Xylophilus sp.]
MWPDSALVVRPGDRAMRRVPVRAAHGVSAVTVTVPELPALFG